MSDAQNFNARLPPLFLQRTATKGPLVLPPEASKAATTLLAEEVARLDGEACKALGGIIQPREDNMEDDQMFGSFTTGAARMKRDLGDDLFAALSQPGLLLTGGYPLRVACGLPTGDDVDVLSNVDDYSALRNCLIGMGYKVARGETSTGFRAARAGADLGVYFREKWNAPGRMSVDCLILITAASHGHRGDDVPADTVAAARAFIDTYDTHAHRHMVDLHERVWFATPEAVACIAARTPGWVDGSITHDERRARWDALLPGTSREVAS